MHPLPAKMHAAANNIQSIGALEAMIPGLAVLVDASEQPIYLPQYDEAQKKRYSGKAKRHTMKTQYATTYDCTIFQTPTVIEGSMHDFAIFKESVPTFPEDPPHEHWMAPDEQFQRRLEHPGDSAYTGMEKAVSQHTSMCLENESPERS